jgi:hypothetical protein
MWIKLMPIGCAIVLSCSTVNKEEKEQQVFSVAADSTTVIQSTPRETVKVPSKLLKLLNGKVQLDVPEQLQPMDKNIFLLKYPNENQNSTIAYSDEEATVSLLVNLRHDKATQADLPKYQQILNENFGNNHSIDFRKSELKHINGKDFIVIEMITPAVDTRVYNLMFVTSLEGKLLMGTFNCTIEKAKEWQPIAEQILNSIKMKD